MRGLRNIVITLLVFVFFAACEKENINSSSNAQLKFSTDTVTFDTIWTSIGSTTKNFRVTNPTSAPLTISSIKLAGGDDSGFRLNIDGEAANEVLDLEILPNDSIFVFVEVTLGENGGNIPMVTQDSIIFRANGIEHNVKLVAWGLDFTLVNSEVLKTSTWTSEKPYLVYNYAYVDSGEVLTIEKGTIVHFHRNAGLYVKGSLVVEGEDDEPVIFQGDRLEPMYQDLPDQWSGIVLFSGSRGNKLDHAIIKNANIGLQVGTIEHEGAASVELANTRIENMSWSGIWAMKSNVIAHNCVISNVRYYNTALLLGGEYEFYHTTFANYYKNLAAGVRNTETVFVSNYLYDNNGDRRYVGDLKKATFGNCVISGDRTNELMIAMDEKGEAEYLFDHCLIQLHDTFNIDDSKHFVNILKGADPRFVDINHGNFELDTLSAAKDVGTQEYAKLFPEDFHGESRLDDQGPDLGAFERFERDPENKE